MRSFFINVAIVIVLLCAPVSVFFMGWGLLQVHEQMGMFVFLVACFSYFIAALGIASLIDKHQDQSSRQQDDL